MRNRTGNIILVAIAAALGVAVALQATANAALRRSNRDLRVLVAHGARGGTRGETAIEPAEQLPIQARAEHARLESSIQQLRAQLSAELMKSTVRSHAATPKSAEHWKDLGRETPSNTVHSVLWAAMTGDVEKLSSMLTFDPDLYSALRTRFETLPESARSEFRSAEVLGSTIIAAQISARLSAAELIDSSEESLDRMSARFLLLEGSARPENTREVTLRFKRAEDGWRLVVPASALR